MRDAREELRCRGRVPLRCEQNGSAEVQARRGEERGGSFGTDAAKVKDMQSAKCTLRFSEPSRK